MITIDKLVQAVHELETQASEANDIAQQESNRASGLLQAAFEIRGKFLEGLGYKFDAEGDCIRFKGKIISEDRGGHDGEEFMIRDAMEHAGHLEAWDSAVNKLNDAGTHTDAVDEVAKAFKINLGVC